LANLQVLHAQNLPLQLERQPITEPSFVRQIQFLPPPEAETSKEDVPSTSSALENIKMARMPSGNFKIFSDFLKIF